MRALQRVELTAWYWLGGIAGCSSGGALIVLLTHQLLKASARCVIVRGGRRCPSLVWQRRARVAAIRATSRTATLSAHLLAQVFFILVHT